MKSELLFPLRPVASRTKVYARKHMRQRTDVRTLIRLRTDVHTFIHTSTYIDGLRVRAYPYQGGVSIFFSATLGLLQREKTEHGHVDAERIRFSSREYFLLVCSFLDEGEVLVWLFLKDVPLYPPSFLSFA